MITIDPHPLLDAGILEVAFPRPLSEFPTPESVLAFLKPGSPAPIAASDETRAAVRDLLRHGGYKPTGRGKPSSEYLLRAVGEGTLSSINLAVDLCNAVSLHSGLPISVIDPDLAHAPLSIAIAKEGSHYAFNASAQVIDVSGLLCLHDAQGPCANAVKDSQRTKTSAATERALYVIWGTKSLVGRCEATLRWLSELLQDLGLNPERTH